MSIGILYVGLLGMGVIYALIVGFFGWMSDIGHGDFHMDASGHLDAGHPSPLSGTVIATFITGFGGGGTLAHYLFHWSLVKGLLTATISGLLLGAAAFLILDLIFSQTQAGSEFTMEAAEGREAEVITSIPENGTGEVAYLAKGQRETAAARTVDGKSVAKGRLVVIEKVLGNTVYVRAKI